MGICLDTDASTDRDETEDAGAEWKGGGSPSSRAIRTPPNAMFQNQAKVKFDPPKVPVIFVLGGPGSGKVTHCDTLINEKRGLVHINMMDLLQQFALGNDMADFSQLPSKTVTEVLMLEMKMAPAAKAYLVSGYPRSMRDVVEYSEKIQVVSGVVLISWRQSVLQKQIDYGAKLGHVVLSLAKMELENFFKNVMPVADYFDQSDMLVAVNGERAPPEVYKDFRTAVLEILDSLENQEALLNGVTGMGRGLNDIPGSIVSVETAPSQHKNITETIVDIEEHNRDTETPIPPDPTSLMGQNYGKSNIYNVPSNNIRNNLIPPVIWVIGGPGSNKATLCLKAVGLNPGWGHFSIGRLLRTICDTAPRVNSENYIIKESLASGEMVPEKAMERLIETNLQQLSDRKGVIIDGYPRNMAQVEAFETKYHQKPFIILLDCSKLQLGRGRIDDTVSSFRRRLELFRELTLPMLKNLDGKKRLTIVDGDTDSPSVQKEFEKVVRSQIQKLATTTEQAIYNQKMERTVGAFQNPDDAILNHADEDNMPGAVPTVSEYVSMGNGHLKTNERSSGGGYFRNSVNRYMENGRARPEMNGHVPTGANVRHMIENESYM